MLTAHEAHRRANIPKRQSSEPSTDFWKKVEFAQLCGSVVEFASPGHASPW